MSFYRAHKAQGEMRLVITLLAQTHASDCRQAHRSQRGDPEIAIIQSPSPTGATETAWMAFTSLSCSQETLA